MLANQKQHARRNLTFQIALRGKLFSGFKLNIDNCFRLSAAQPVSEEILMLQGRMLEIHFQPPPSACLAG